MKSVHKPGAKFDQLKFTADYQTQVVQKWVAPRLKVAQ